MRQLACVVFLGLLLAAQHSQAQDDVLAEIRDILQQEIRVEGFRLAAKQEVQIEAVGFRGSRRHGFMFTRAWILDSRTREVIWEMEEAEIKKKSRTLLEYEDQVTLPKGAYEVYYSSFPHYYRGNEEDFGDFVGRILDEIFDRDDYEDLYDDYREEWKKFKIVVWGKGKRYPEEDITELHDAFRKDAFVSMTALRDDEYKRQGFMFAKPAKVQVYAIGEVRKDGTFDYGWIINTKTREKVWKLSYRHSKRAGGSKKNRMVNEVISLPAGRYVAFFVTDDSHSYGRWNASPPYDPMFWGLTLKVQDPSMLRNIKLFDYEELPAENVIVKFTRLGDDEFKSKGFTLKKPMDLRIYAIGEGKRKEMFDYGWIVDAKSHKRVWEMEYYNTEHAGGGEKNRLFDDVVHFDKGSYIVYFITDGSHSYRDWNTTPPPDQDSWGITILAVDGGYRPKDVVGYEEKEDHSILAKLVRIRDDAFERESFTLDKESEIRIYAIGEGSDGTMYDYGWIEDAETRRVLWEMTYRKTDRAGGARKNRLFDGTILLKAGEYAVYYESDGSHSFNDWNAAPPYDPVNWGITVYLVEEE
ncbi:MAG: hypothetical protein ACE5IW_05170 [bacterium]